MAEQAPSLSRHDLEVKIVKRCWEDEAFRAEFIADPAGAFTKYLEVPKDSLPKIVVHEEGAGSWRIVIPAKPRNIGELAEQDLERIAGGTSDVICVDPDWVPYQPEDRGVVKGGQTLKLSLVSKVGSVVSAVIASGIGSLIAGQNIDTGW
jgi:hypothetical protein